MTDDTTAQARAGDGLDLAYLTALLADATRTPISTRVHIGSGKALDTASLVGLKPSETTALWAIWTAAPALIAAARERDELREELSIWKSVFPDIAPKSVLPDRSLVMAENTSLRALLAQAEEYIERARSNLSFAKQDAVKTAAEAEYNRNSAYHDCVAALAAIRQSKEPTT